MKKYFQIYLMTLVIGLALSGNVYAHCGHCEGDKKAAETMESKECPAGSVKSCCAPKSSGMCTRHGHNSNAKMNFGPKNNK